MMESVVTSFVPKFAVCVCLLWVLTTTALVSTMMQKLAGITAQEMGSTTHSRMMGMFL